MRTEHIWEGTPPRCTVCGQRPDRDSEIPCRTPITEQLIREMRLACGKFSYSVGGNEYRTERAHKRRDPRCWWYTNESWLLSIGCPHNSHGEYYLSIGEPCGDSGWFCFLQDGQYSGKFLHLRHIRYFDELVRIVEALTDLRLCRSEAEAKAHLDAQGGTDVR